MNDTEKYNADRDAYENGILNNVRQIIRNADAGPLIAARLPFVNKTRSFRGNPVFGLDTVRAYFSGAGGVDYAGYRQSGTFPTFRMSKLTIEMFVHDLGDIASCKGNAYVVTSYRTVIGWTRITGELYVPEIEYSPTTTKHQRITAHPDR